MQPTSEIWTLWGTCCRRTASNGGGQGGGWEVTWVAMCLDLLHPSLCCCWSIRSLCAPSYCRTGSFCPECSCVAPSGLWFLCCVGLFGSFAEWQPERLTWRTEYVHTHIYHRSAFYCITNATCWVLVSSLPYSDISAKGCWHTAHTGTDTCKAHDVRAWQAHGRVVSTHLTPIPQWLHAVLILSHNLHTQPTHYYWLRPVHLHSAGFTTCCCNLIKNFLFQWVRPAQPIPTWLRQ